MLRLLGLATRAGAVLPGTERVREAARAGALHYVLLAVDASDNSRQKLEPLLGARQIPYAAAYTRDELGAAVGRGPLSAIGITEIKLASRVKDLLQSQSSR